MRAMRSNGHIGDRIMKKWGKIGSPKSAKRKAWLKSIRPKKKRSSGGSRSRTRRRSSGGRSNQLRLF